MEDFRNRSYAFRAGRARRDEPGEGPGGGFVTLVQIVLAALLVGSAFLLKSANPDWYERLRQDYAAAITREESLDEAKDVLFQLYDGITGKGEGEATPSSTPAPDAGSSSPSAAGSAAAPGEAVETMGGMGGLQEVPYDTNYDKTMAPPANASYEPYTLTVTPTLPVSGRVTSPFGYRWHPITKKLDFHTGVDIAAAKGTKIAAALAGTVVEAGQSRVYGNYILLQHGEDLYTFYGHCDSLQVAAGTVVRQGETIGYVGTTGLSTGPHLHLEIRLRGKQVDPRRVFPQL